MYQTADGFVVWETILVFSISNLAVSFYTSDPALCILTRFLETLRDMFPASWLSPAPPEDNIVGILFFHTSHVFLWSDADICIVLTSVGKRELLRSGKKSLKIGRRKHVFLQSKEMFAFLIGFMSLCQKKHGCFLLHLQLDLLDLPADHASSKRRADLACFVVFEHLNICRRKNKNGNNVVPFCSALPEMLYWELSCV